MCCEGTKRLKKTEPAVALRNGMKDIKHPGNPLSDFGGVHGVAGFVEIKVHAQPAFRDVTLLQGFQVLRFRRGLNF